MLKLLHTRIRVGDLDRSIRFYEEHLGFKLKSRNDRSPAGNHIAHLELPGNAHTIELTWSAEYKLAVPEDLMRFAIGVPDLSEQSQRIPLDQCVGVLSVVPQSPAWKAGLRAGDFILRVEDKKVDRPALFRRLVDSRQGPVELELANQRTVVIQAE